MHQSLQHCLLLPHIHSACSVIISTIIIRITTIVAVIVVQHTQASAVLVLQWQYILVEPQTWLLQLAELGFVAYEGNYGLAAFLAGVTFLACILGIWRLYKSRMALFRSMSRQRLVPCVQSGRVRSAAHVPIQFFCWFVTARISV